MKKKLTYLAFPVLFVLFSLSIYFVGNSTIIKIIPYPAEGKGCMTAECHEYIEPIREHGSGMAQAIYKEGKKTGDPNGCIVCHSGNPEETRNKDLAHKEMIRDPGSMWVNDKTCGECHPDHVYNLHRNLMQSEAGKIQGALWGWGAQTGYKAIYGNYAIDDPDGLVPRTGSSVYKNYMKSLIDKYPDNFPVSFKLLPDVNLKTLNEHPEQAALTYIRTDCQRCHLGVRGAQRRGDYRGMGCSACHIPYGDEGLYEGRDESIDGEEKGHLLVHSMQSSRKAKVRVNGKVYSGIPAETCASCHNRGKRIGVSFLGLVESSYDTPYTKDGKIQPKLHGKRYIFVRDDHHHSSESRPGNPNGGLLCQDCHTTTSVHGNGNIGSATYGEVEIECADCHGTPDKYPWELPIGYGDEFGIDKTQKERGTTEELIKEQYQFSTVYLQEDGYLLTARGNPIGNVIRKKNAVIVHSASGLDFEAPALKNLEKTNSWKNPTKAKTAMAGVKNHLEKLECYSCHSGWAPQCYGCHVKVDYSEGKSARDWVKSGNIHYDDGETSESRKGHEPVTTPGMHTESRSYVRWEDPVLGINGEGRVGPIITGCQQITTVIGEDGQTLVSNKIWRTPPGMENGGEKGQRGIDMTPAQPHTVTAEARSCPSCHTNPKALGYGINDGQYLMGYQEDRFLDLRMANGEVISRNATPQMDAIPDLPYDLSQVVTRDGKQLQTVGHHWPLSRPLDQDQRDKMERVGVCMGCHRDLPDGNIPISMLTGIGDYMGMKPHTDGEHSALLNSDINLAAITRLVLPIFLFLLVFAAYLFVKWGKKNLEG